MVGMELRCGRCKQDKPATYFNKNAARKNRTGYDNYCRDCMSELDRQRRERRKAETVPAEAQCSIPDCTDRRKGHGYCNRHLKRFREHGNPLAGKTYERTTTFPKRPTGLTLEQTFRWFLPGDPPAAGIQWLWPGPVDEKGYGTVRFEGRNTFAHRIAYELFVGPIPEGMVIRHKNDVPLDVNPHNLEVGTLVDNVLDRVKRRRSSRGPRSGNRGPNQFNASLSENEVIAIRAASARHERQKDIAERYGMSVAAISQIVTRKTWKHIP